MTTTPLTRLLGLAVLSLSIYSSAYGMDNSDAAPGPLKKPAEDAVKDVFTATGAAESALKGYLAQRMRLNVEQRLLSISLESTETKQRAKPRTPKAELAARMPMLKKPRGAKPNGKEKR